MRTAFIGCLPVLVLTMTAVCAEDATAPSLVRGVPSDAIFVLHWNSAEKGGFARAHLRGVREALHTSGFIDRYVREYRSTLSIAARREFEQQGDRWKTVLSEVPWWSMMFRECVVGVRIVGDGRLETIGLFRVGESRREGTIGALRNILYAIAGVGEGLELDVGLREGVSTAVLYDRSDYGEQICVSGWRDVVVVSSSTTLARQAFHLLQGRGRDIGFVHTARYAASMEALSKAVATTGGADGDPLSKGRLEVWVDPQRVFRGMPLLDVIESYHLVLLATSEEIVSDSIWSLTGRTDSPLLQAIASQKPVTDLLGRLPASAAAFSVVAGSSPVWLWDAFLELAVSVTGDAELAERIERGLSKLRVPFRRDVLENLSGRRVMLGFAREKKGSSPLGSTDIAYAFEVKDSVEAKKTLETIAVDVAETLEAWSVTLEKDDRGLYTLSIPLLEGRLHVAVVDTFVVIATSHAALEEIRAVRSGGAASLANAGVRDGIPEGVELDSVFRGSWDGALGTADWLVRVVGFVGTLLPDEGVAGAMKPFCVAVSRLVPVVNAFDFLRDTRAYSTRDGRRFYAHSRTKLPALAEF